MSHWPTRPYMIYHRPLSQYCLCLPTSSSTNHSPQCLHWPTCHSSNKTSMLQLQDICMPFIFLKHSPLIPAQIKSQSHFFHITAQISFIIAAFSTVLYNTAASSLHPLCLILLFLHSTVLIDILHIYFSIFCILSLEWKFHRAKNMFSSLHYY